MNPPDNAPVLVAVAAVQQKQTNIAEAKEPITLMIDAVNAALKDSQAPTIAKKNRAYLCTQRHVAIHESSRINR